MVIKKHFNGRTGFTLMELLVVIAIIMALIGILVPGIQGVKRIAKNLEQKSLFHGLEIGIETYRKDFGDYPKSELESKAGKYYTGAQHLAEAMVGRDSMGFEPMQSRKWTWPGEEPSAGFGLYDEAVNPKTNDRRKPKYVNLKDTGAFLPGNMYSNAGNVVSEVSGQRAPVIADMFYRKKIIIASTGETVKVGSPILYYKANTSSKVFYKDQPASGRTDFEKWKYNYYDNKPIIDLGTIEEPVSLENPVRLTPEKFYKSITDTNASLKPPHERPMNETTFILISAGYDGIYGTKDDVTNIKIK